VHHKGIHFTMEFQFKSFGDYGCHKEGVQLFGGMVQNLWEVPKMEDDGKVRAGYELVRNGIPAESECLNLAYQPAIVKVFIENFNMKVLIWASTDTINNPFPTHGLGLLATVNREPGPYFNRAIGDRSPVQSP